MYNKMYVLTQLLLVVYNGVIRYDGYDFHA